MAEIIDGYTLVLVGRLALSFQRYPESEAGLGATPRSHGALPVALTALGRAILPLAAGEAMWIGLSPAWEGAQCRVAWAPLKKSTADCRLPRLLVSSFRPIFGLRSANGQFSALIRETSSHGAVPCSGVIMLAVATDSAERERLQIQFIDPRAFEAQSGRAAPGPLSPGDAYGGWHLP
ncbi:hypothetical protein [Methylobacterium tarhaniae]|uniref:hypothetical protein n=1 Tax=Methylobacterium tarhaniae TaxID=1187852 RepID=UPI003CFC0CD9